MVRLDRITTGAGDKGSTALADGTRVAKNSPRVCAYGTVDEVNCLLGLVRAEELPGEIAEELLRIQHDLYDLGADLATPPGGPGEPHIPRLREDQIRRLEAAIAAVTKRVPPAESFILPGGSRPSALLHLARTVSRRAERDVVGAMEAEGNARAGQRGPAPVNPLCLKYLNRLSDLCFVWARLCNDGGRADILWKPFHER